MTRSTLTVLLRVTLAVTMAKSVVRRFALESGEPRCDGGFHLTQVQAMGGGGFGAPRFGALIALRLGLDKAVARDRFLLGKAAFLVLVATAAGAGIIASGLGHCGQHLRAEEDASFVPRPAGRRHIPRAAARL